MSESLPVRGTILSTSPCTLKDAATLLRRFLESGTVPEAGLLRGYLVGVSAALDELVSRRVLKRKERPGKNGGYERDIGNIQKHEEGSGVSLKPANSKVEPRVNGVEKGSNSKRKHGTLERTDGFLNLEKDEHDAGKESHPKRKHATSEMGTNEQDGKKGSHSRKHATVEMQTKEKDGKKGKDNRGLQKRGRTELTELPTTSYR